MRAQDSCSEGKFIATLAIDANRLCLLIITIQLAGTFGYVPTAQAPLPLLTSDNPTTHQYRRWRHQRSSKRVDRDTLRKTL